MTSAGVSPATVTTTPGSAKMAPVTETAPPTIAYQGEPGSNSHIVCTRAYPEYDPLACVSFEDVFATVTDGIAELAMIPIDNSIAGRVADIHHFLPTSDLHIVAEHFLPIEFSLLGVPGATLDTIRTVHSHVHALGQCRKIIRQHRLTAVIAGDTAGSAREIAEGGDATKASLATPLAAEIYGLTVLASGAGDEDHNTTRFVTLSKQPKVAPAGNGPTVTSFVFNVRNLPAALYKALGGFATNSVNMTKLESYMVNGEFTATQFLAEVEGHPDDTALSNALEELAFYTHEVKILGVYPADPFRAATAT